MKNNWMIFFLALICFVLGTSEYVIVGVLDQIASSTNISIAQAGQLISIFAITASIGTPISIYFLSSFSQRTIIKLSFLLIITSCFLMTIAPNYPLLLFSRIIMALGVGVFNVLCFIVASNLALPNKKGRAISTVTLGYNAALIVGLPIGRVITAMFGWKAIFFVYNTFCHARNFFSIKAYP